jgi:hypothetical protein
VLTRLWKYHTFVGQYKFKQLVDRLAGDEGAALFEVTSELGPGFYVLIAYTICGGFVHYFFSNAVSEYYALDPNHKIDSVWTILFGYALTEVATVEHHAPNKMLNAERSADIPNEPNRHHIAEEDVI